MTIYIYLENALNKTANTLKWSTILEGMLKLTMSNRVKTWQGKGNWICSMQTQSMI